ncbi:acyltransferase family protein [Sphingomonas sp. 1P08PE]|uniref:acyltransferase family protein n=1 Tax=Sphingomonas sp. 1P08PE TaxID=554122 RepID=UPI0039A1D94D
MRGIAALSVFTIHASKLIAPVLVPHAYLAVDLFFLLSGFVIDHAYSDKLARQLTPGRFIIARYIRLYPLYLIGLSIGFAGAGISLAMGQGVHSGASLAVATITGLFMLPSSTATHDVALVPLNYPAWSLLFELAVNVIFALTFRWLTTRVLLVIATVAALCLCWTAYAYGSIDHGMAWSLGWVGAIRVTFSFFLGVAIRRVFTGTCVITRWAYALPLLVLPPMMGFGGTPGDLIAIIFLFPLIIGLAACVEPPAARTMIMLGTLSYPLYVIHIPTLQFIERVMTVTRIDPSSIRPTAGIIIVIILAATALALDRWYDRPVRRWLSIRLLHRRTTV